MAGTGSGRRPRGAIPHTISDHLCIDFVNSRFTDHTGSGQAYDRLEMAEWRLWFAERCGVTVGRPPSAVARRELAALRELLRTLLESGRAPNHTDLAAINRSLSWGVHSWELSREGNEFRFLVRCQPEGWRALMAAVAVSYCRLLVSGQIGRVRSCANPDCSFLFVDDSYNASRRWCDPAACGNLLAVRRHRQRTNGEEPGGSPS